MQSLADGHANVLPPPRMETWPPQAPNWPSRINPHKEVSLAEE